LRSAETAISLPIRHQGASMADVRYRRLEQYEARATEYEILARVATDRSQQNQYEQLAAHYRSLAVSFREARAVYSAALAKLTLH
jgi:hypothetical protein